MVRGKDCIYQYRLKMGILSRVSHENMGIESRKSKNYVACSFGSEHENMKTLSLKDDPPLVESMKAIHLH